MAPLNRSKLKKTFNSPVAHPINGKIIAGIIGCIGLLIVFFLLYQAMNRPTEIRSKAAGWTSYFGTPKPNQPSQPTPRNTPKDNDTTACYEKCDKKNNLCIGKCALNYSSCTQSSMKRFRDALAVCGNYQACQTAAAFAHDKRIEKCAIDQKTCENLCGSSLSNCEHACDN